MTCSDPARTTTRRVPGTLVAGLLVVIAAIAADLGYQLLASSSSTAASPVVPDGTRVFDDERPAVAKLDPDLLGAIDDGCPPMYADPTHDPRMQQ